VFSLVLAAVALGLVGVTLLAGAASATPPSARDDSVKTKIDTKVVIDVLANDRPAAGDEIDPKQLGVDTAPEHGTVVPTPAGKLTYTPNKDWSGGDDSFTYSACSVGINNCSTATVSVTVGNKPFNALPVTFAVIQTVILLLAIRLLDPYEHEPLSLLGIMAVWGATGASLIAWDSNASDRAVPIVEETAKGTALVIAFLLAYGFSRRFGGRRLEGATAGLVYGAAIGLGFAFTEDVQYGLTFGIHKLIVRRDYLGYGSLTHALFTAVFGVGLGLAFVTRRKLMRVVWPVAGLLLAITLHELNNGLKSFSGRVVMALAFASAGTAIWFWLAFQRGVITDELTTEAQHGLVSPRDIKLTPRYWRRQKRRWDLLRAAQLQRARAEEVLHTQLARLAFAKRRYDESVPAEAKNVTDLREATRRAKAEVRFARLVETRDADEHARRAAMDAGSAEKEPVVPAP
jgi:RsiW-degrading membrane proteinase PrsW (M82 family)